ncbi:MAG: hypothetical protein VCA34_14175 [Roseibacillus sp.]
MPKLSPNPPPWLRTVMIALLMGFGAVLILFPAWLPEKPSLPIEDSAVEILQSALLSFSAALLFATAPHAGPYRAIYRSLGFITIAALLGEIGDTIDNLIDPLRHEYFIVALFIWTGLTLLRRRKETLHFIGFASRHPASGFVLAAIILVYAFSRVFGSEAFWNATLDGQHHPDTPRVCRGYLELLACYFVLLGAIGYCLPLTRRRYRMTTEL